MTVSVIPSKNFDDFKKDIVVACEKRPKLMHHGFYNVTEDCGCPVTELAIDQGLITRTECRYGSMADDGNYMDIPDDWAGKADRSYHDRLCGLVSKQYNLLNVHKIYSRYDRLRENHSHLTDLEVLKLTLRIMDEDKAMGGEI